MKKSLLISASLLTLSVVTGIYAQSVGATGSIVDKMKAVAHSFTLGSLLNPTDTGLTSDPVKGKKTGDILTAGEWNRVLELVSEGGTGGGSGAGWENVPLEGSDTFDKTCEYRFYMNAMGLDGIYYVNVVAPTTLVYISHSSVVSSIPSNNKTSYQVNGSPAYTVSKIEKRCGGGATSSGGGATIVEGGIIKTSAKTISNWDLITLEGSWNSGGGDAAPTGGYIYKLGGQAKLAYVEASGISKDITLTTTAQNVHNLTVKLSGNDVVIDPSSTNTLAYLVWKLGSGGTGASGGSDIQVYDSGPLDMASFTPQQVNGIFSISNPFPGKTILYVKWSFICVTNACGGGYASGDEVEMGNYTSQRSYITMRNNNSTLSVTHEDALDFSPKNGAGGAQVDPTNANWRIRVVVTAKM